MRSGSCAASILVATTIMGLAARSSEKLRSSSMMISNRAPDRGRWIGRHRQVGQHAGALDVAQEMGAEAVAQVCALDQAGNVGDHVAAVIVRADDAQVGLERGEGVIRDFRAAAEMREISVDLPALGKPTSPTSASSFNSRRRRRSSPS